MALPCSAIGLSVVCDCGISWSYSDTIFVDWKQCDFNFPLQFYSFWERVVYRIICLPSVLLVLCLFVVLVDFQFITRLCKTLVLYSSSWSLLLLFIQSDPFCKLCLFIYLISSVFVVLCLESIAVSMMYFQNLFLNQVTGNFSRESVILWAIWLY